MKVIVNNSEFEARNSSDDTITVNQDRKVVKLLNGIDKDVYTFSVNNKIYTVSTSQGDEGIQKIYHDGSLYEVEIKAEKEVLLEKYMTGSGSGSDKTKIIKSPMPGLVVKINCAVGDEIKKGDKPIVIEAMKMENALASPGNGKVKAINVSEGQAVEKNVILIELE